MVKKISNVDFINQVLEGLDPMVGITYKTIDDTKFSCKCTPNFHSAFT